MHQNKLAFLNRIATLHEVLNRHAFEQGGCNFFIFHVRGRMQQTSNWVVAMCGASCKHGATGVANTVAYFEVCDIGANGFNNTHCLSA